jgi:hypothetical protein
MSKKIPLQLLIGKQVRDPDEVRAGRIFSVQAEIEGNECIIREYHLGSGALLEQLGISMLRIIGWPRNEGPLRVPWDQLDLSDPERPRLRCRVAELRSRTHG